MPPHQTQVFGLSLALQAQFPALVHPCDERIRAANVTERSWAYAKINGAATVRERSVFLKSPVLPPASGPPKGIKPAGFRRSGHGETVTLTER